MGSRIWSQVEIKFESTVATILAMEFMSRERRNVFLMMLALIQEEDRIQESWPEMAGLLKKNGN